MVHAAAAAAAVVLQTRMHGCECCVSAVVVLLCTDLLDDALVLVVAGLVPITDEVDWWIEGIRRLT
jgi:hypothetical protein